MQPEESQVNISTLAFWLFKVCLFSSAFLSVVFPNHTYVRPLDCRDLSIIIRKGFYKFTSAPWMSWKWPKKCFFSVMSWKWGFLFKHTCSALRISIKWCGSIFRKMSTHGNTWHIILVWIRQIIFVFKPGWPPSNAACFITYTLSSMLEFNYRWWISDKCYLRRLENLLIKLPALLIWHAFVLLF